jgi:hypothetical protein
MKRMTTCLTLAALVALGVARIGAQAPARGTTAKPPEPPKPPRAMAPLDLVGTWVAVISEDWRWRMVTPPKGDLESVPLNDAGKKLANTWTYQAKPDAETACKPFGAGGIMRIPGRLRFSWADDSTLKLEFDAGTQTRLLKFPPTATTPASAPATAPVKATSAPAAPSWQGTAVATWEYAGASNVDRNGIPTTQGRGSLIGGGGGGGGRGGGGAIDPSRGGSLKVVTNNLKAGYLRKNGAPYSASATITEYYDRLKYPNGDSWLIVRTVVRTHLPHHAVHHQHELQARGERLEVQAVTVRHRPAGRARRGRLLVGPHPSLTRSTARGRAAGPMWSRPARRHQAGTVVSKGRLEAFSDGVIAIIITIMVLELKVPPRQHVVRFGPLVPIFISYVLSFVLIAIYWNNHHHLLQGDQAGEWRGALEQCAPAVLVVADSRHHGVDGRERLRSQYSGALRHRPHPVRAGLHDSRALPAARAPGRTRPLARAIGRDFKGWVSVAL